MEIKDNSIKLKDLKPQTVLGLLIAEKVYDETLIEMGIDLKTFPFVITSLNDGPHMKGSLHYTGEAFDMRIWAFGGRQDRLETFLKRLKKALSCEYDAILEKDHIHVEYDPKD